MDPRIQFLDQRLLFAGLGIYNFRSGTRTRIYPRRRSGFSVRKFVSSLILFCCLFSFIIAWICSKSLNLVSYMLSAFSFSVVDL